MPCRRLHTRYDRKAEYRRGLDLNAFTKWNIYFVFQERVRSFYVFVSMQFREMQKTKNIRIRSLGINNMLSTCQVLIYPYDHKTQSNQIEKCI